MRKTSSNLRRKLEIAISGLVLLILVFGLFSGLVPASFWNALASVGTIFLAVMTYLTLRQNTKLIEQSREPRVYVAGKMYAEGSSVYTSYRVSNNKSPRSYLKLTVSNLSVYPIQIVEIATSINLGNSGSEYTHESIEYFVPPQSSISIEYASNTIYADERLMLFFYYGAKERGYFYVSSPVYRQRTERAVYRVNTLSQEIGDADETVSQFEDRQQVESYDLP